MMATKTPKSLPLSKRTSKAMTGYESMQADEGIEDFHDEHAMKARLRAITFSDSYHQKSRFLFLSFTVHH